MSISYIILSKAVTDVLFYFLGSKIRFCIREKYPGTKPKGVFIIYEDGGGGGAGKWERGGGQATFTPLFRGGGSERFYSKSGEEGGGGGGGQESLKVDIISLGF